MPRSNKLHGPDQHTLHVSLIGKTKHVVLEAFEKKHKLDLFGGTFTKTRKSDPPNLHFSYIMKPDARVGGPWKDQVGRSAPQASF